MFRPSKFRPDTSWNPNLPFGFHCVLVPNYSGRGAFVPPDLAVAKAWCAEQFGAEPYHLSVNARWASVGSEIRIRDEADAVAFKIRWC